ncbi:hypothetical protein EYR41_009900 [Orbilia oligospora]|uniref:Uncharacterized protein n=1 Tax=Orbilia oligospora TaxID=2813651 RepID=A0A8H2DW33_ORBOL|nr:hypothetical protein EYR41_009900 [Orbilia oligospora]
MKVYEFFSNLPENIRRTRRSRSSSQSNGNGTPLTPPLSGSRASGAETVSPPPASPVPQTLSLLDSMNLSGGVDALDLEMRLLRIRDGCLEGWRARGRESICGHGCLDQEVDQGRVLWGTELVDVEESISELVTKPAGSEEEDEEDEEDEDEWAEALETLAVEVEEDVESIEGIGVVENIRVTQYNGFSEDLTARLVQNIEPDQNNAPDGNMETVQDTGPGRNIGAIQHAGLIQHTGAVQDMGVAHDVEVAGSIEDAEALDDMENAEEEQMEVEPCNHPYPGTETETEVYEDDEDEDEDELEEEDRMEEEDGLEEPNRVELRMMSWYVNYGGDDFAIESDRDDELL